MGHLPAHMLARTDVPRGPRDLVVGAHVLHGLRWRRTFPCVHVPCRLLWLRALPQGLERSAWSGSRLTARAGHPLPRAQTALIFTAIVTTSEVAFVDSPGCVDGLFLINRCVDVR